jgi:hypothetical protein
MLLVFVRLYLNPVGNKRRRRTFCGDQPREHPMAMKESQTISRRQVVSGAGIGLAAAAASPAFAQDPAPQPLQDPTGKYPKPPFPAQSQPWPGLAGLMSPKPDHGETSYVGSGRLAGRKALITGGDSGMGRAAAIAMRAREQTWPSTTFRPRNRTRARSCS